MPPKTLGSLLNSAKSADEAVAALRLRCARHGEVRRLRLSCSAVPGKLYASIEIDGAAGAAAADLGGEATGDLLHATFTLHPDFCCRYATANSNCLCLF